MTQYCRGIICTASNDMSIESDSKTCKVLRIKYIERHNLFTIT